MAGVIEMLEHVDYVELNRFADNDLPPWKRWRIASHVRQCHQCRSKIAAYRGLSRDARSLPSETVPEDLRRRVLDSIAAGTNVIVPDPIALKRRTPKWHVLGAAAVVLLGVSMLFVVLPEQLASEASEMTFSPENPAARAVMTVRYRSTSQFADFDRLVLRGRFRRPGDPQRNANMKQIIAGELVRGPDGVFQATVQLPEDVVYAVFSVEDVAGRVVDSNGRALWELLVHVEDKPTFAALVQQRNDLMGRWWTRAFGTVQLTTELYPNQVESWQALSSFERAQFGINRAASLDMVHQQQFARFDSMLAGTVHLSGDELGNMYWYARADAGESAQSRWRRRLLTEAPRSPNAVLLRTMAVLTDLASESDDALGKFEELWQDVRSAHPLLIQEGYRAAITSGDPTAILRWYERYLAVDSAGADLRAIELSELPATRRAGIQRLRHLIRELGSSVQGSRPLIRSVDEHRRELERTERGLYGALGRALLADGEVADGVEALERAAAIGWDSSGLLELARVKLNANDSTGALAALARLAVDPSVQDDARDSVDRIVGRLRVTTVEWDTAVLEARSLMFDRVLREIQPPRSVAETELFDSSGTVRQIRTLVEGAVTFVAFWHRLSPPSVASLAELQQTARIVDSIGGRVLTITPEQQGPALSTFLEAQSFDLPVFYDRNGDAVRAFQARGTPLFFVVDQSARIRFAYTRLEDVPRQVAALIFIDGNRRPLVVEELDSVN